MQTLAILSRKGGTGKTTLATHLAVAATAARKRTVLLDLDPQRSALDWSRERGQGYPVVAEGRAGALFTARQAALREGLDLMILDTRPSADADSADAARYADLCLIVVRPSWMDVKAIGRTVELVTNMRKPGLFVINQAPSRRGPEEPPAIRECLAALKDFGLPVAPVGLRYRVAYQSAVRFGQAAQEHQPDSLAAFEVNALWEVVRRQLWPSGRDRGPSPVVFEPEADAPLHLALAS